MEADEFFCYKWTFRKEKAKANGCPWPEPLMDRMEGKSAAACAHQGLTLIPVGGNGDCMLLNDLWCDVEKTGKEA